ncbi:MAG: hypothetical protein KF838_10675 [Phycisphaeraceae bacterium]|nr:MAG: hypothetical protein KF838_10675 [Phycisphaeraceae bacterium]
MDVPVAAARASDVMGDAGRGQSDGATDAGRARMLREFLASNDAACPVCGYNLRGLLHQACPECNAPLSLGVTSENLSIGPWVLAIVSFAMAAGFDGVVATVLTVVMIANPPPIWLPYAVVGMFMTLAIASLACVLRIVRLRRRWAFQTRRIQWRWALMCLGGVFTLHACIGIAFALLAN